MAPPPVAWSCPVLTGSVLSGSREGWQRGAYGLRMKFLISVSRCRWAWL